MKYSNAALMPFFIILLLAPVALAQDSDIQELPEPRIRGQIMRSLKNRVSVKGFKPEEMKERDLADVLWAAFGVADDRTGRRTAPSAFNAQEIDIYVLKSDGCFRYDAERHALVRLDSRDMRGVVATQSYAKSAPVHLVFVADYGRAAEAYPASFEREADAWARLHTGFLLQNVTIFCSSRNFANVVRSGGDEDALRDILKLENDQEIIVTQAIGYSPR